MQEPISKKSSSLAKILLIFLRLGFTSFGGPTAHLGFFRDEFVEKRKWLSDAAFADLVALCQFLPGPASSQVGYAIGLKRGGWLGGAAAWIGFTIPSAVALVFFGLGIAKFGGVTGDDGWLRGLQIAVVAVIAKALWGMARSLCPDRLRAGIAIIATGVMLAFPGAWMQVGVIIIGAIAGLLLIRKADVPAVGKNEMEATRLGGPSVAIACLVAFFALLFGLPIVAGVADQPLLSVFAAFYKTGSLVFGGGHVVLPMLQAETVAPGWVTESDFPGRLWRSAGGSGAVIHLQRFSRQHDGVPKRALDHGGRMSGRRIPTQLADGRGTTAILGETPHHAEAPSRTCGNQCGCRRSTRERPLQPDLDSGDSEPNGCRFPRRSGTGILHSPGAGVGNGDPGGHRGGFFL